MIAQEKNRLQIADQERAEAAKALPSGIVARPTKEQLDPLVEAYNKNIKNAPSRAAAVTDPVGTLQREWDSTIRAMLSVRVITYEQYQKLKAFQPIGDQKLDAQLMAKKKAIEAAEAEQLSKSK